MAESSEVECDAGETFLSWLKNASIEKHQSTFVNNGIPEVSHLEDVTEEDSVSLGLTKYEAPPACSFLR